MAFTFATWNILATGYIRREFYPKTPRQVLDPAWRVPAVVRYAIAMGVDILCLQEVETDVFMALQMGLAGLGYMGTHALKGGNRPDGCATFFRGDCFTLVTNRRIAYADGDGGADSGHIAQLLVLEQQGKRLAVVNTHLKWDPPMTSRERQWGYRQALQALEALRLETGSPAGQIVCGDFNVTPRSDVIQVLQAGGLDYAHRDCAGVYTFSPNGEPKLIDYLFYGRSLRARPMIPAPIDERTSLPSSDLPSDHVPLVAEFDWA